MIKLSDIDELIEQDKQKYFRAKEIEAAIRAKQPQFTATTAAEIAREERERLKSETCNKCGTEKSCLPIQIFCDDCMNFMSYNSYLDHYGEV